MESENCLKVESGVVHLNVTLSNNKYVFQCKNDSPLGELHDALSQMKGFVMQRMAEVEKASNPKSIDESEVKNV